MFRWLINKATQNRIDDLEVALRKLLIEMEGLNEQMKRTRAYVGYYKAPGRKAREDDEQPDPLKEFYASTIEAQQAQEAIRAQQEGVGGEPTEEIINNDDE